MDILNKLLAVNQNYILIALMFLFYTLEQITNTQFKFKNRPQHLFQNLLFLVVFVLANLLWATVTVVSINWMNERHIGLLYIVQLPYWLKLIAGVALFDFVTYWFHRAEHVTPLLWRLHRVHHSDTSMDASTNFRNHPIELIIYFGGSNIIAAGIFGLDLISLGLYFLVVTPFVFLEHSNLRFPGWIDKTFGLVFTTPNLHKVHHDQDQYYTDSNFSDIFILWDRLFGTFKYKSTSQIKFGLKEFDDNKKQTFWYLMRSPFIKVRRINSSELKKINLK